MFKIFKLRYIFWDNIKKNVKKIIKKYRYLELQDFMHFLSNFFHILVSLTIWSMNVNAYNNAKREKV